MSRLSKTFKTATILVAALLLATGANASLVRDIGNFGQIVIPSTALAISIAHKDPKGAAQFSGAFLSTLATVKFLKHNVNERRPKNRYGECCGSFPSGHTALSFASAAYMQMRYGLQYGIPAYIAAGIVGGSRITSKMHWAHDVFAGAAIGIGYNLIFTRAYKKQIVIAPLASDNSLGLQAQYQW